jgi:hypothetical protein
MFGIGKIPKLGQNSSGDVNFFYYKRRMPAVMHDKDTPGILSLFPKMDLGSGAGTCMGQQDDQQSPANKVPTSPHRPSMTRVSKNQYESFVIALHDSQALDKVIYIARGFRRIKTVPSLPGLFLTELG